MARRPPDITDSINAMLPILESAIAGLGMVHPAVLRFLNSFHAWQDHYPKAMTLEEKMWSIRQLNREFRTLTGHDIPRIGEVLDYLGRISGGKEQPNDPDELP